MTWFTNFAPAREILPAQRDFSRELNTVSVEVQPCSVCFYRVSAGYFRRHRKWITPLCRTRHHHCIRRHLPAFSATELNPRNTALLHNICCAFPIIGFCFWHKVFSAVHGRCRRLWQNFDRYTEIDFSTTRCSSSGMSFQTDLFIQPAFRQRLQPVRPWHVGQTVYGTRD